MPNMQEISPSKMPKARKSRAGGRAARHALREAAEAKPVEAGLIGGKFRPLTDEQMDRVNDAALKVLEEVGIADPTQELLDIALPKGCFLNAEGRLCYPRALIEDIVSKAAREYVIYSRSPEFKDIEVGGNRIYYSTSGEAVSVLDIKTRKYRPSTIVDLYDFCRLTDRLEHLHQFGQTVVPTEIVDLYVHDINVAYAQICATQKPMEHTFQSVDNIDAVIEMYDMVAGGEGKFAERPFASFGGCPIVSPLRFAEENLNVMIKTSRMGLINDIAIAPQAGATAPAKLAGTLVQVIAEGLSLLAVVNMVNEGCPMTFACWPFVSDLRTGSFTGGSGEEAILGAAAAQMGRYYDLPNSMAASMTDSKMPDAQAGYEKGITAALAGHAGANRVLECAGMMGSLMGCSHEALVIDNDMIGMIQRTLRGIEITDESLSVDAIKEVCFGPGHYLGHDQTIDCMETEYLYPVIADRQPTGTWEQEGSKDMLDNAHDKVKEILSQNYPTHINEELDNKLRDKFPILLPKEAMNAKSGRW